MFFDKIKTTLKKDLEKDDYNRYIKNIEIDEENSNSDSIVLKTPNIYISNFIKRYYLTKIVDSFTKETGIKPNISLITKDNTIKTEYSNILKEKVVNNSLSLSKEFTFENFVVGESNQFAYTVSEATSKNPFTLYNPLLIYGGVGLGKTHLMQAIGNVLKNNNKVVYVSSEQFMNEFTYSIRNKENLDNFRAKYRECDVLLIDDIQFLAGKDSTQEEFFHTFETLINNKKQICLTSDKKPTQIPNLTERLKSRFSKGILADIQPPDLKIKKEIIEKKCNLNNIKISHEVINFISTHLGENIREIEGILTNMNAMAKMMGDNEINLEIAKNSLNYIDNTQDNEINLDKIKNIVATEFNVKPSELVTKNQNRKVVDGRHAAIYLAREYTKLSTSNIAQYFGLKTQSSIAHSLKSFNKKIKDNIDFKNKLEKITTQLK